MVPEILVDREDGVGILTLNRPHRLNALTRKMLREDLPRVLEEIRREEGTRVLILTGAGEGFCSGADVAELPTTLGGDALSAIQIDDLSRLMWGVVEGMMNLDKPIIGAINGMAAGGGFSLALLCDIRLASERARFSMAFIRRGLIPDLGATYFLPRLVGPGRALEIILTGDIISAQEAERLGLVNRVVTHEQLMPTAKELAHRLARGPAIAIALSKKAVYKSLTNSLKEQVELEALSQVLCRQTEDFQEGVKSFLEKREPVFKGR